LNNAKKPKSKQFFYPGKISNDYPLVFFVSECATPSDTISNPISFDGMHKLELNPLGCCKKIMEFDSAHPTPIKSSDFDGRFDGPEAFVTSGHLEPTVSKLGPNSKGHRLKRKSTSRHLSTEESEFPEHLKNWFKSDLSTCSP
jgi:hypothetical protein